MINFIKKLLGLPTADIEALLRRGARIIDVRTGTEFKRWHIDNSVHIEDSDIPKNVKRIRKMEAPIITCCRNGRRSDISARVLRGLGIEAYNGGSCKKLTRHMRN